MSIVRPILRPVVRGVVNHVTSKYGGISWQRYWTPPKLGAKALFWGKVSEIVGGRMPNKITGSSDYLTIGGSAGSYTFQTPQTDAYRIADTDRIWCKQDDVTWRITTETELKSWDFVRTFSNYEGQTPYEFRELIIVSDDLTDAEKISLTKYLHLSPWTFNEWIEGGEVKENKAFEYTPWMAEPMAPSNMVLALIVGGVRVSFDDNSGGTAQHEIYAKIDAGAYALITTLDAADVSYDDIRTPEDLMTYKVRGKIGTGYSDYCTEDDIVMLGANLVPSASSDFATDGSAWWTSGCTKSWNAGTHDLTVTSPGAAQHFLFENGAFTIGRNYLVRFDAKSSNLIEKIFVDNAAGTFFTDITNLTLSPTYQTFKFSGLQSGNQFKSIETPASVAAGKEITFDNIKIQEIL